jgi:UDP-2,3-diacylglucosamine pyrophosphatase LpxH
MNPWQPTAVIESLPDDRRIWFISDLHLGDGTPSDAFFGKDKHLMALIRRVEQEEAILVIVGDAMDFHQAWTFARIMRAHEEVLSTMSRIAREGRLYYVLGNHDFDLNLFRQILNFRVCHELQIGNRILVRHGHQFDPYISDNLEGSNMATKVHHLLERILKTWVRLPLGEFYTIGNRLTFWSACQLGRMLTLYSRIMKTLHLPDLSQPHLEHLEYWSRSNMGDPMCMLDPIEKMLADEHWETIICGHAHLPCQIRFKDKTYINTGSWSFGSTHYAVWDGKTFRVRDWITGREFHDEMYQNVLDGSINERTFLTWWNENYMGWLRFRCGEERTGRLRGWEAYIRDQQFLAQLPGAQLQPLADSNTAPPDERDAEPT